MSRCNNCVLCNHKDIRKAWQRYAVYGNPCMEDFVAWRIYEAQVADKPVVAAAAIEDPEKPVITEGCIHGIQTIMERIIGVEKFKEVRKDIERFFTIVEGADEEDADEEGADEEGADEEGADDHPYDYDDYYDYDEEDRMRGAAAKAATVPKDNAPHPAPKCYN